MLQGFYSAASGVLMQQRNLNVISNNLANARTPGYKANTLISTTFEQTLLTRMEGKNSAYIGTGNPARIVEEVVDIFKTGEIISTDQPFDVALNGSGFFNVQGEDGQTYITRDGQFDLDDEGYLILRGRGRVLGTDGAPIQLGTSDIIIDKEGNITHDLTGVNLGILAITIPGENAVIEEARNGMYLVDGGPGPQSENPKVIQGSYENSNVNLTDEMAAMIMAQRNFSSASQALQIIDKTYNSAVNIAQL